MPRLIKNISDAWERNGFEDGVRQVIVPRLRELIRHFDATLTVYVDSVAVGVRSALNLIAGKDIALTAEDDVANERVNVTIARADKTLDAASVNGAISFDLSGAGRYFQRTLTGDVTSIAISAAPVELGNWLFEFVQDATGLRTLPVLTASWPAGSRFLESVPPVLGTTASSQTFVNLHYNGTSYFWSCAAGPFTA